jgi:hypothetical protein
MMSAYVDRPRQSEMNEMTQILICNFPTGCSINFSGRANYTRFWSTAFSKRLAVKVVFNESHLIPLFFGVYAT